jgi:hypothetical protein
MNSTGANKDNSGKNRNLRRKDTPIMIKTILTAALVGGLALHTAVFAQSNRWDELSKLRWYGIHGHFL